MTTQALKNWQKYKLGDLAQDVRQLYTPTKDEKLPYVGLEHIEQQTLHLSGVGQSNETESTKKIFKSGDVLFGTLRPYFRKVTRPKFNGVCSTDIAVIRPTKNSDGNFLKYFIANQDFIDHASNISSGTRMPRINWKVLKNQVCLFPKLTVQKEIGDILVAYDDLIENNTRRIQILEQMAQAIYTEWFVNFRFPGHKQIKMVDSGTDFGKIPEEWEVLCVKDIIQRISPGKLYDNKTVSPNGKIPVLDQGRSGIIGYHNDGPGVAANIEKPVIVFANHTCYQRLILFSFSAIQNILPFYPLEEKYRNIFWLHFATKDLIKFNDYKGHWPEFMQKKLVVPTTEMTSKFAEMIKDHVILSYQLGVENQNLRQTRDLLLPKLVNGEIRV